MSNKLNEALQQKLVSFGQRRLKRGEIFLLAKAIADKLPIGTGMPENIRTYTLNLRDSIDRTVYGLSNYIYIPQEDATRLYALIDSLLLWRMSVAFNPAPMLFSGDPNTVVDEVSSILRYVDVQDVCSVSDVAQSASYIASIFQDYVVQTQ